MKTLNQKEIEQAQKAVRVLIVHFDELSIKSSTKCMYGEGGLVKTYGEITREYVPCLINYYFKQGLLTEEQTDNLYNMLNSEDKENHLVVFTILKAKEKGQPEFMLIDDRKLGYP